MIPVLFNKEETTFTSLGLGEIDATVVEVERERNGIYTLYMELPFSSDYVALIEQEMQIKADAGARTKWQTFKINRVIKDTDKKIVKVYADHISMDTINDAMKPRVAIRQQTAEGALRQWNANRISTKQYDVSSDITTVFGTEWTIDKVENARQALGGVEGSILDVWGGEYEFDNNRIILHKEMGREAPTVLEYGRNIVKLEYEELIDGVYTSIYPYATYTPKSEGKRQQEPVMVTLDELIVDGNYAGNYENKRIQIVDFSSKFDSSGENPEIPTQTKLRSLAESYVKANEVGAPKITQEVDFVDLSRTLDYQDMQVMEEIELNDRVPIFYPNIQITSGAKVIKTVWQPLINQYKNITVATIGALKSSSLNSNLKTSIKELEKQQKKINDTVPYLINAQGNRIWYTTPDDTLEHKIDDTWFKQNGKYTIMYRWNGSMWEEVINNETFSKELEAQFAEIEKKTQEMTASITEAYTKAASALEKVDVNTNLISEHKKTLTETNGLLGGMSQKINSVQETADGNEALIAKIQETPATYLADYQKLINRADLVERTLGTTDSVVGENVSRMVQTSGIIQTEVASMPFGGRNLLTNTEETKTLPESIKSHGNWNIWAGNPGLIQGETYTLSFEIKSSTATYLRDVYLNDQNSGLSPNIPISKDWTRVKVTFEFKGGRRSSTNQIAIHIYPRDDYSGVTEVRKLQLEKGMVASDWGPAVEDTQKQLSTIVTQLDDSWGVKIKSADEAMASLSVNTSGARIAGKNILLDGNTSVNGDFWAKQVNAIKVNADNITTGTLDGSRIRANSIDVNSLAGNRATLVSAGLISSSGGSLELNGNQILSTASDGSQVYLQNGILGVRRPSSEGGGTIGQIGYVYDGDSPTYTIRTTWGSSFAIKQTFYDSYTKSTKNKDALSMYTTDDGYSETTFRMSRINILGDAHLSFLFRHAINGNDQNRLMINGAESVALRANDSTVFAVSNNGINNSASLHANLNMQGNTVTNTSDIRLKRDVVNDEIDSLSALMKWQHAGFYYTDPDMNQERQFSVIAQSAPDLSFADEDGYLQVSLNKQVNMTSHALQQHVIKTNDKIAQLEHKIASLQDELELLKGA